ncbi:MAG: hypothetical protein ACKVT0_14940 [Planctomycetaceae bacterium]
MAVVNHRVRSLFLFAIAGVAIQLIGCGESQLTEPAIEARKLLQTGQPQMAIDALRDDDSVHGHYLQGVALERLKRFDAAREQIGEALKGSPENLSYQAFDLRLRMQSELKQGKMDAVEQMIQLHQQHPSHAGAALFTCYAYQAKAIQQRKQQKFSEVSASSKAGVESLKNAIAMSATVPELQREILSAAATLRVTDGVTSLVDRLYSLANNEVTFVSECVNMYTLAGDYEKAIAAAKLLHQSHNRSEQTALILAHALAVSTPSLERDREFADLQSQYARNTEILSKYAIYLARSNRLTLATKLLNAAIDAERDLKAKQMLIYIAVSIPLESGTANTAEEQLKIHRAHITDKQLISYFEARILYLKKQYQPALMKLARILDAQKKDPLGNRALAKESLQWMQRILADQDVAGKLEDAARSTLKMSEILEENDDEIKVIVPADPKVQLPEAIVLPTDKPVSVNPGDTAETPNQK